MRFGRITMLNTAHLKSEHRTLVAVFAATKEAYHVDQEETLKDCRLESS